MADADDPLSPLLAASHFIVPDALPGLVAEHARALGATAAVLYLVDLDQRWLVPLPPERDGDAEALAVDSTLAGRCYRSMEILETSEQAGDRSMWVPVVDGTERLGVLLLRLSGTRDGETEAIRAFVSLVGELVMAKGAYGDFFERSRRRQPLSVAAELLWQLLPPLSFATEQLMICAALVPTADLGGDAFDYGVDPQRAQVAIFDAMGHDLQAGLLVTAAVAAYRNARRRDLGLPEVADAIHRTILSQFGASRFVTGILTSLDIATGRLSCVSAGHPPPLVLRAGQVVETLERDAGMPFGLGPSSDPFVEQLEPGDGLLLYTDGVTDVRSASGELFGVERLVDLLASLAGADPPPETMRRLMRAIEGHNHGPMHDDGTVVLVEWRGTGSSQLVV